MNTTQQVLLIVLDGWGYREETKYNAIAEANPEYMNHLWEKYPHTLFEASGEAVGLPKGNIGTSEIGHTTLGAGRIIDTDIIRVNKSISTHEFDNNEELNQLITHVQKFDSTLHVMGLVSPGGVHSHQDHLFAFLKLAKAHGVTKIVLHIFTDGRDTAPQSASHYVTELENIFNELGAGHTGTIIGRYYAMDRDKNWDRTQLALDALFEGKGEERSGKSASAVIRDLYSKSVNDEFIKPQVLLNKDGQPDTIKENDGLFFFNFRPDRARQITKKVLEKKEQLNLYFVTLTNYDVTLKTHIAFPPVDIKQTLADILEKNGLTQAHIAETEKYAHVTFFFNGLKDIKHQNEEQILIDSRKDIPTHDLGPEMRAKEIADSTIEQINKGTNFIVINLANADMVGHTGKWEPTIKAVKFEDEQIKRVTEAMLQKGGVVLITADHGNAEVMFDEETQQPVTAHSLCPIPFIVTKEGITVQEGSLADVAPTILKLFDIEKPQEMTGKNLID